MARVNPPEWVSGNVFIRRNLLEEVGDLVEGHTHAFDHTTIIFTGAVRIIAWQRGEVIADRVFAAPAHCLIRADVEHEITATEPHTEFWCVYSHRDSQARVSLEYTGWEPAYR